MAIYRDVGHEAEFAIPISLISRAKRHSHAYETHVKSEAPNSVTITYCLRTRPPSRVEFAAIFPQVAHRAKGCLQVPCRRAAQLQKRPMLSSLPSWSDGDGIAPGRHTRT